MIELQILTPQLAEQSLCILGTCSGAGLNGKEGIFFYNQLFCGFFGMGVLITADRLRIAYTFESENPRGKVKNKDEFPKADVSWNLDVRAMEPEAGVGLGSRILTLSTMENTVEDIQAWADQFSIYRSNSVRPESVKQLDRALELYEAEKWSEAQDAFDRFLQQNPQCAMAKTYVAHCLVMNGDCSTAEALLLEAEQEKSFEEVINRCLLAEIFLKREELDKASTRLEHALQIAADNPWVNYLAAWLFGQRGEPDRAEKHLTICLKAKPENTEALFLQMLIHCQRKELDAAERICEKASRIDSQDFRFAINLGRALLEAKEIDRAEDYFKKVSHLVESDPAVHQLALQLAIDKGDVETARRLLSSMPDEDLTPNIALLAEFAKVHQTVARTVLRYKTSPPEDQKQRAMLLLLAASCYLAKPSLPRLEEVDKLLRRLEDSLGPMEKHIGESEEDSWLRTLYCVVRGKYLYHRGGADRECLDAINKAVMYIEKEQEESPRAADIAAEYLEELRQISERVADRLHLQPSSDLTDKRTAKISDEGHLSPYQATLDYYRLINDRPELLRHAKRVSETLEEFDRPLLITVVGEFNVGKSTFINALIGEAVAPMDVIPSTATINHLKYGEKKGLRIFFRDGKVDEAEIDELERFAKETTDEADRELLRQVDHVEILYPLESLKQINIVDTPGLNAVIKEHQQTTESFIEKSDAAIWLFRADAAGKESERTRLEFMRRYHKKTVGVVNQIDLIEDDDEVGIVLDKLRKGFVDYLTDVIGVSAKAALEAKGEADPEKANRKLQWSRFSDLERLIQNRLAAYSRQIKEQATIGKVQFVHDLVVEEREGVQKELAGRVEEIRAINERVQDFQKRFEVLVRKRKQSFQEDIDELMKNLAEGAMELFLKNPSNTPVSDISQLFVADATAHCDELFFNTRDRAFKIALKFKDIFDKGWAQFFESYDSSLEPMFKQLRGYFEAKMQDLDDYFESERYFFHGYMRGGMTTWASILSHWASIRAQLSPSQFEKRRPENLQMAIDRLSEVAAEMVSRHNKRYHQWLSEFCQQLYSFVGIIRESIEIEYRRRDKDVYWPVQKYFTKNIEPMLAQEFGEVETVAIPSPKVAAQAAGGPSLLEKLKARFDRADY